MDKYQSELRDEPTIPAKTWQERQSEEQRKWEDERENVLNSFVENVGLIPNNCQKCLSLLPHSAVRCRSCKKHLCWKCDFEVHSIEPFHLRSFINTEHQKWLNPSTFFYKDWNFIMKGDFIFM